MSTIKLPRGYEFGSVIEIKKPNTDTILHVYDKAESRKVYGAMLALLEGSIEEIDGKKPSTDMIRKMPMVSAEVAIVEALKMYKLPTLLEGVYPCPRCNTKVIHEQTKDEDTRDDICNLPIKYDIDVVGGSWVDYKSGYYTLDLSDEEKLQFGDDTFIQSITFRDPTIADMMSLENDYTLKTPSAQQKKLYVSCIADIEFMHPEIEDWNTIKNRYMYELVKFDDYRTFDRITLGLRRFGYHPFIQLGCGNCHKIWESAVDFTGFFVYALRSNLGTKAKS